MLITRRSLILAPVVTIATPALSSIFLALGEFIIELFVRVLEVGIELLLTSAAKYIYSHYFSVQGQRSNYLQVAQPYIEQGRAADNFCPYCTVEYANKSKRFWNGQLFDPNEDNNYYRGFNRPTDQVLLDLTRNSEALWYLDSGRNPNAHLPTAALDELRERVRRLENDKTKIYYDIERHAMNAGQLDQYLIPRTVLREIDKAYEHVTSEYHLKQEYVEYLVQIQKFSTWFNAKLLAIDTASTKGGLIA